MVAKPPPATRKMVKHETALPHLGHGEMYEDLLRLTTQTRGRKRRTRVRAGMDSGIRGAYLEKKSCG